MLGRGGSERWGQLGPGCPCPVRQTDRPPLSSGQISVSPLFWGFRAATTRHWPSPERVAAEAFPDLSHRGREAGFSLGARHPSQGEIVGALRLGLAVPEGRGRAGEGAAGVLRAQTGGRPRHRDRCGLVGSVSWALPGPAVLQRWFVEAAWHWCGKLTITDPGPRQAGAWVCPSFSPFVPVQRPGVGG